MSSEGKTFKKLFLNGISMLLWAVTAYIAGYQIFLIRSIVAEIYLVAFDHLSLSITMADRLSAIGVGNIASLMMAIIAIVIVVGGFDYHWSHGGEPRSFKVLAVTLIFQLTIQALYIFL